MTPAPRRATPADLPALLDLADALVALDRTFDPSLDANYNRSAAGRAWLEESLDDPAACVRVLDGPAGTLDGMLIGRIEAAAPWRATGGPLAELEMLSVTPARRGQGLGKVLVDAFARWAGDRGAARLWARVSAANAGAIRFYKREGLADYDVILERPLE